MLRRARMLFAPIWRAETYRRFVYVLTGAVLGLCCLLAPAPIALVTGSVWVVVIGFPLIVVVSGFSRTLRDLERLLAGLLLGSEVPAPAISRSRAGDLSERLRLALEDPVLWRAVLWLGLRATLCPLALSVAAVSFSAGLVALMESGSPILVLLWVAPLGLLSLVGLAHLVNLLARVFSRLAMPLLGPSRAERLAALQRRNEQLAERARLARDLHDSVGHTMTVAVLQAGAARKVFDSDPAFVARALATIEDVGREALDELDRVLGILREGPPPPVGEPPGLGFGDIEGLLDRARATGLPVRAEILAGASEVPDVVGREVYRIVQEGCTNVMRHAGLVPTLVSIGTDEPGFLSVMVENGPPEKTPAEKNGAGGRGLRGAAERVDSLYGAFEAGPTGEGGFRLRASLPLKGPEG